MKGKSLQETNQIHAPGGPLLYALNDPSLWKGGVGLMTVPLRHALAPQSIYVLLNGASGNFCLDVSGEQPIGDPRSIAWSSNVGHYVAPINEFVHVYRWDHVGSSAELYRTAEVEQKPERFHRMLEERGPKQGERSVIAHAMGVFRNLRAGVGPDFDGNEALEAFLYLLAATADRQPRGGVNLSDWSLSESAESAASEMSPGLWEELSLKLMGGRPVDRLATDLELLLRHASGQLFQEIHYIALHSFQRDLFVELLPPKLTIKRSAGSTGVHFTPPALARSVVEEALAAFGDALPSELTVFDPACGSGEFLREAVRQIALRSDFTGDVRVIGYDISEAACNMARFVLSWETRELRDRVSYSIEQRDSLRDDHLWPIDVDLCLMNPPFVSYEGMNSEQRDTVARVLGAELPRRQDMSTAFVWRATRVLARGGVIGSIVPASFFDGENAAPVRRQIADDVAMHLVARLGSHQLFPDALVDAGLYVGRAQDVSVRPPLAIWADHRLGSSSGALRTLRRARNAGAGSVFPIDTEHYSLYHDPALGGGGNWAPRPYQARKTLIELEEIETPRVQQVFDVKQGARTGFNQAFILKRDTWAGLPDDEQRFFRPAVLNESIRSGRLGDSVYVFYPYAERQIENEKQLRESLPIYFDTFLSPNKPTLLTRARVDPNRWWDLSLRRTWQDVETPKLVSTYFGDRGSFAWDSDGRHVVVQGFGWMPWAKHRKLQLLSKELGLAYLALLNSQLFSALLAASSNSVAGGQWNLSQKFVKDIPLPILSENRVKGGVLSRLVEIGRLISEVGLASVDETLADEYDEIVRTTYRLPSIF